MQRRKVMKGGSRPKDAILIGIGLEASRAKKTAVSLGSCFGPRRRRDGCRRAPITRIPALGFNRGTAFSDDLGCEERA
jgi:hypothetical protein